MQQAADFYSHGLFTEAVDSPVHQKAMLDATPDCIKIISTDGILLSMNRAGCLALNVPLDSRFGMPWLPLLPEDVHAAGEEAIRLAAGGQSVNFAGKSLSPEGIVYWDNLITPILDPQGTVVSLLCVSRNVTKTTELELQLREAVHREQQLAQEMRHRIKNVFTVVSGLITMAQREALSSGSSFTPNDLKEKLYALARASEAVFIKEGGPENDQRPVEISTVIGSVLEPYIRKCTIDGTEAFIHPGEVTSIALLLHELATNSVKYGALGSERGRVHVDWNKADTMIKLTWTEKGGPAILNTPAAHGFGTAMVDRVIQASRGKVQRNWSSEGLIVTLDFPCFRPA